MGIIGSTNIRTGLFSREAAPAPMEEEKITRIEDEIHQTHWRNQVSKTGINLVYTGNWLKAAHTGFFKKDVLLGIREGLTSKQIAEKFSVNVFTVRNHRSNIFGKAHAQNMVQLIRYAEASGWI